MAELTPYELAAALKAARSSVNNLPSSVNNPQLTLGKPKDRHKPGYMAAYMRKRRADKKKAA